MQDCHALDLSDLILNTHLLDIAHLPRVSNLGTSETTVHLDQPMRSTLDQLIASIVLNACMYICSLFHSEYSTLHRTGLSHYMYYARSTHKCYAL